MRPKVAIVYNEPDISRYAGYGEEKAILGVLDEVEAVELALAESGYPSIKIPLTPPIEKAQNILRETRADVIFNLFEGFDGRPETEAELGTIIAGLGFAYTGCPPAALALALNKATMKELLAGAGVRTPRHQELHTGNLADFRLNFPCIVKPVNEDASHGITEKSVVHNLDELDRQVKTVTVHYGGRSLVEEFLDGREFNATIVGNKEPVALPVSEIVYTLPAGMPKLLTFASKWEPESIYYHHTEAVCPANIDDRLKRQIAEAAKTSYRLVGCSGYARVDMRLDTEGIVNVLEVNPNPDISPTSGAARQVKAAGMTYSQFIERVIERAMEGH
jgi:D-alanine-D-alanine ligase